MKDWIINVLTKTGCEVAQNTTLPEPVSTVVRNVQAPNLQDAIDKAVFQSIAIQKLQRAENGSEEIMSDRELDWLIDNDLYPLDMLSIPNPRRLGILDAYLVGQKTAPAIAAFRAEKLAPRILALG